MQPIGLVSALPQFAGLDLFDWKDLVVGGHDIRHGRLFDEAMRMHTESRAISADILAAVQRRAGQDREESPARHAPERRTDDRQVRCRRIRKPAAKRRARRSSASQHDLKEFRDSEQAGPS